MASLRRIADCGGDTLGRAMPRLAVFDLDGTLVDSAPDIHAALDRLMAGQGRPGFARPEVTAMIGDGVASWSSAPSPPAACPSPRRCWTPSPPTTPPARPRRRRCSPASPTALDGLAAAGWGLAVCTNKPAAATAALLGALGLEGRFAAVGGGDSFPVRKPDPAHLLATLRQAGGDPAAR